MSKSDPDTIVDPMEVIPEFGTDALRLALVAGTTAGNDQRLGKSKIVANRNFANKLWNIARYIEDSGSNRGETAPKSPADHWILNKLSISAAAINKALDSFRFSEAYELLYHFVWDDFADWYIEASKVELNIGILNEVLESTLKLAHPFAPFITETIWQKLGKKSLLASELWPEIAPADKAKARQFEELKKIINEARQIVANVGINKPWLFNKGSDLIDKNKALVARLGRLGGVETGAKLTTGVKLHSSKTPAWLAIDIKDLKTHSDRLKGQVSEQEGRVRTLEGRLAKKAYVARAPKKLVADSKAQLAEEKAKLHTMQAELKVFEKSLKL